MSNQVLVFLLIDYYKVEVKLDFSIFVKMIPIQWCLLTYCLADKAVLLLVVSHLVLDQDFDCYKTLFGHFHSFNQINDDFQNDAKLKLRLSQSTERPRVMFNGNASS